MILFTCMQEGVGVSSLEGRGIFNWREAHSHKFTGYFTPFYIKQWITLS